MTIFEYFVNYLTIVFFGASYVFQRRTLWIFYRNFSTMLTLSQKHFSNSLDIFSVLHIIYFCEFANDLQMQSNCICTFMILYNRREDIFMLLEVIKDTVFDSLRLLPFLFLTYLLMEFLEHRAGEAGRARIGAANASGPVWGALFGIIPQCGFSAAASGLYLSLIHIWRCRRRG